MGLIIILVLFGVIVFIIFGGLGALQKVKQKQYSNLTAEIQEHLGISEWMYEDLDAEIEVSDSRSVSSYLPIQYFKDHKEKLNEALDVLDKKRDYAEMLLSFLRENEFHTRPVYDDIKHDMEVSLSNLYTYNMLILYVDPEGENSCKRYVQLKRQQIEGFKSDPWLYMTESEYDNYIDNHHAELVKEHRLQIYERANAIIDSANTIKETLLVSDHKDKLDTYISSLYTKIIKPMLGIKEYDSRDWAFIEDKFEDIERSVNNVEKINRKLLVYYDSEPFRKLVVMSHPIMLQYKEFNEYMNQKLRDVLTLLRTSVNKSSNVQLDDEFLHGYNKNTSGFYAEVPFKEFCQIDKNTVDYIMKYFYSDITTWAKDAQNLQALLEIVKTLWDAQPIMESYRKVCDSYVVNVPDFVKKYDMNGLYTRLGFANVSNDNVIKNYVFTCTVNNGLIQHRFFVPMNPDNIEKLILALHDRLTVTAYPKEQRLYLTDELERKVKEGDNFACRVCGASIKKDPNLLLEINYIIPVSRGGYATVDNLQTLCWKCNRDRNRKEGPRRQIEDFMQTLNIR